MLKWYLTKSLRNSLKSVTLSSTLEEGRVGLRWGHHHLPYSFAAVEEIREKMKTVRHRILVLSGKGGVGKSTFSAHLAHGLAEDGDTQVGAWAKLGGAPVSGLPMALESDP